MMIKFSRYWYIYLALMVGGSVLVIFLGSVFLNKYSKLYFSFMLFTFSQASFELVLLLDLYSLSFLMAVFFITLSVLLFSGEYMENEKFFSRFHVILMSFVLSMVLLILSPNLLSALIGWDGLGVSSYILVIYYGSSKAYNAGMITAATNRLGDGLMILTLVLVNPLGDLALFVYSKVWDSGWVLGLLGVACFTKSAQVPFSAWLPAAMAAPTPVSSLVHSSTLVTAGVYVLIRHGDWGFSSLTQKFFIFVGAATMFMASFSAFFESDMKKMVALSTLSQLGIMVVALGVGNWLMAFLHLLAHAFFKALLFISTGNIIHSSTSYQAMKMSGGLGSYLPLSFSANMICSMSLCGVPFMSAFFSKEPIIEIANEACFSGLIYLLLFAGIMMTVAYSARLSISTGVNSFQGGSVLNFMENLKLTNVGMVILLPLAIGGGSVLCKYFVGSPAVFYSATALKLLSGLMLILGAVGGWGLSGWRSVYFRILFVVASMWSLPWVSGPVLISGGHGGGHKGTGSGFNVVLASALGFCVCGGAVYRVYGMQELTVDKIF